MEDRSRRLVLTGVVVSTNMDKTIKVAITSQKKHPIYKKVVKSTKNYLAHDDKNDCGIGDTVEIMETRPLSKNKYFRLVRIVERAK